MVGCLVNTEKVLLSIDPKKDADGLHPVNLGNLVLSANTNNVEITGALNLDNQISSVTATAATAKAAVATTATTVSSSTIA